MSTIDKPDHYAPIAGVRPIDIAEHLPHCLASAFEYVWRAGKKGPAAEDLRKAAWHLRRQAKMLAGEGVTRDNVRYKAFDLARVVLRAGVSNPVLHTFLTHLRSGDMSTSVMRRLADQCDAAAAEVS